MIDPSLFVRYGFLIKLISSLIIASSCFLIYFKTHTFYELTSYKGIKYFRNTFLFFGITQAIKFLTSLIMSLGLFFVLQRPEIFFIFEMALFISVYAGSMALIYLILSIFWKKIDIRQSENMYFLHIIALIIALVSLASEIGSLLLIIFQLFLFITLIIISLVKYREHRDKRKISSLYLLYLMIFALWIGTELVEILTFISPLIGLIVYILSIAIFLLTLLKVLAKLG